ncbi:hypothetical protein BJ322DRAFT_1017498 [Thelephora terrestris]|uniref:Uncharacterized protein n=1 Tax=Thelephora terrestris TaxID=56493 RepID=A0A9P6HN91_9AGAM|nr:hypothetical protein BJ322DRAFT_1017498 [Thelephora terrestris]
MFPSIATNIRMTSAAGWEEGYGMVGLLLELSEEIVSKSGGGVKDGPGGLGRVVIENFKDVGGVVVLSGLFLDWVPEGEVVVKRREPSIPPPYIPNPLHACSSSSDGEDFEKELQEPSVSREDEVETGSRETPGEVWFDLMSEGLSQVATEMHEGVFQNGLGCQDCWVNPTLRRCLCSRSLLNPPALLLNLLQIHIQQLSVVLLIRKSLWTFGMPPLAQFLLPFIVLWV